ncbi:hypothetical protein Oter_3648 [Opitutus terrae PB90-1]|uniref:Cytochrome c domain-containing protein n=1 Tax=Opitutus terrae (strain DSM 11246 / JCM 15787 / PB90-1) TaxID=452637 RepID=B1ZXD0_OPITP|nr:hypothetical protein Oter_3648 [Opitutus terrae PB90-1]
MPETATARSGIRALPAMRGRLAFRWIAVISAVLASLPMPTRAAVPGQMQSVTAAALAWETLEQSYDAKPGETTAEFSFAFRNVSDAPVEVRGISTSCRCTAGIMRAQPWIIAPGASDTLRVIVDLRSRRGALTKTVYVDTTAGEELLLVHVQVPTPPAIQREMNMMVAQADRQAVLRGDCVSCHVTPAAGRMGGELFQAVCQVCHGAEHRASMVPDLKAPPTVRRDGAYWNEWIRNGKEGTLMPAWDKKRGGVLDDAQIESLIAYLLANLPSEPAPAAPLPTPAN